MIIYLFNVHPNGFNLTGFCFFYRQKAKNRHENKYFGYWENRRVLIETMSLIISIDFFQLIVDIFHNDDHVIGNDRSIMADKVGGCI